jgi:hypothetical protein
MSESFLSDAGSLFFAAWILVVAAVSIVAFGRDLFPRKAHADSPSTSIEKRKSVDTHRPAAKTV